MLNNEQSREQEQLEEIERFLQQQMTVDEQQAFLERLATDDRLKKQTEEYRLLFLGVQEAILEPQLNSFHQNLPAVFPVQEAGEKNKGGWPVIRMLAAACLVGAIALSGWWLFFKPSREEALFAEFFQPDPGLISAMSGTDNYSFDRAMIDYKTGHYELAIIVWDSLLAVRPNSDTLHYFLGSAYMAERQTGKAIDYFRKVEASRNSVFREDAYWYHGLALLQQGRIQEATGLIEQSGRREKEALLLKLKP